MRKYITLSVSAIGSQLRTAEYQGVKYIVAPVISAVGDTVIFPANAPYPEFVPAEVLSLATESRNFRPVVMNHPVDSTGEYCSANSPEILEKYCYGFVFGSRFEDGRVKSEIWLDPIRANQVGSDAEKVIERLQNKEIVEVSEGSYVTIDEASGIYNGDEYNGVWTLCIPDHLATLSEGVEGACSVNKQGCGAGRVASKAVIPSVVAHGQPGRVLPSSSPGVTGQYTARVSALSQARTPVYSGTESTSWSVPSFSQYVKYLHPGSSDTAPKSVSQCSTELKKLISSHSLLGDPDSSNISGLTTFPVVNPSNGKLNEKALRAVLSKSSESITDTDITSAALSSAQDMARRLLNAEFGSNLEVSEVKNMKNKSLLSRITSSIRDAMSNNKLRNSLEDALREVESGLWFVEDYDPDRKTVVYTVRIIYGGGYDYDYNPETKIFTYQRTYNVDGNEKVTINDDKLEVQFEGIYVPVPATEANLEVSGKSEKNDKSCSCKGDYEMAFNRDSTIKKLIASKKFTEAELKASSDGVLKALEESLDKPAVNGDPEENKSADHGDKTIIENTPEEEKEEKVEEITKGNKGTGTNTNTTTTTEDRVTLSKDDYTRMKAASDAFAASEEIRKNGLIKTLSANQTEYTEPELKSMKVVDLERMCSMLKVEKPVESSVNYSFARGTVVEKSDDNKVAAPLSVMERIRNRDKKTA